MSHLENSDVMLFKFMITVLRTFCPMFHQTSELRLPHLYLFRECDKISVL